MKTKPKRHKASNTFKFQTFSERISSIDYDVFHKVKHPYQEDDEEITYYAQALTKWNTESFSPGYYELRKKLPSDVNTLPQLLVLKDDIMKTLLDHLKSCDIESLQPALELIVAVAKDLRKEFFPYFNPGVLQECIRLLDTREVEQIEWTFTCLAHLFKFLWANIVKNINIILPKLLPLLSSSKPSYINNFVAESFAFVARKVRDKLEFLLLSLKNVKKSRDELDGVSKLFFEVMTGVSSQFHSCTEEFLSVILKQLNDRKSSALLFQICEKLVSFVTSFVTSKTDIAPVWNTFMKITNEFHSKWQRDCSVHNSENLDFMFKLILKFINGREVLLSNPQEITDLAMNLVTNGEIRNFKSLHVTLIDVLCCILTTNKISTKIRNTNEMIVKILGNIDDDKVAIRFVDKIIELNQYESIVFREFLKYVNIRGLNDDLSEFLTKIVYTKTNFSFESGKNSLDFFTLGLRSVPRTFTEFLLNKILDKVSDENIHQVENSLHSIIVLSFTNLPAAKFAQKFDKFFSSLCTCIEATENVELKAKLLYSLLIFVQYRFKNDSVKDSNINKVIALAAKYINSNNYLCSLRILDSLSESSAFECLNSDEGKIRLINNLSSPFHKVRLFSSHVLSKMNISPVFDQISEIEMIYPTIETYRDKLQRLQKFECDELFANIADKYVRLGVLKFLFGNMYINFLYMWEPTQKLIQSHLENDPNAWSVFTEELEAVATNDLNFDRVMEDVQAEFKCEFLKEHFYQLNGVDDRPDFYNVRCLLSSIMTNISNYSCIDKNLVADHFLKFYKSEYTASNNDYGAYCNVTLVKERVSEDLVETGKKTGKNYNKLFLIYLKLVNNLTNQLPKKSKSDIFDIHFELLSNGNSDIQKYAVSFICRIKDMNSYKERLHLLTNDNTIKDQLRFIRSDLESNTIPEQDVPYLMKIVLKILFGKVRKKSAGNLREAMFEFLVNCKKDEIIFFFDMIFKEFSAVVKDPSDPVIHEFEEVNLEKALSPSWVLNYLNHVTEIFKKCGGLLQDVALKYLLRVLLKCISIVVSLQNQKSSVHPCYYNLISKMRVNAFEAIIYFVENFEYVWSKDEMNALFKFFVDSWIEKISEECLQSPNPLMKLFITFTKNPKFFPLLAKKSRNLTALEVLMKLLNNDKVYFNVKNSVVEVVERLLTLEDEIDEEEMREFMYHDDVHKNKKKNQRYGMTLLMPYVSEVLQYLQASLSKKYIRLNSVYMLILKRVSEFGLNEESSAVLLNLLLPILRSKVTSSGEDDVVTPLLDTIINLFKTFKNAERFKEYLLQIAYLLGVATTHSVRQNLCELVSYISDKTKKKFIDSELICGLNLDDKKWIGQPDYDGRLKTFKSINEARDNEQISVYSGIFIVYNCFYMIKNVKDIALRDHSGLCLKNLCPALCEKFSDDKKQLNLFLNDILLPLIREGILSDDENYQHESLALLGFMARECSKIHFVFRDLHPLIDREDVETDFFENILHLQHFRRIKTLKRFTEIMSQQVRSPSPYTLTFLFPLVTKSLLSAKFSNEHGLIDAAIEALGIICRLSSWRYYEKLLKFYVMEMRKNVTLRKQAIRIVSVILDSFHFDISQADQTNCVTKSDKVENDDDIEPMEVDEEAKDIVDESQDEKILPVVQRMTVLCRSDATRVYRSIKSFLIPSLNRIFLAYDDSDQYHKQSKKDKNNDKEEMAVLSIPIAFAAVKLMKKLPKAVLEEYISTIFLKLSTYLKSRLPSIRLIARETMQNVLIEVGPKYLPRLLSEMMSILTKGFQIHVLVSTCHAILEKVSDLFIEGEIDSCVDPILEICIVDLFGKLSEEKEVGKITGKTPEAKGNKSYHMLNILSENITQCHVLDIILPLKQILAINMSTKTVNKIRRCLQYVALGLVKNKFIDTNSILELAYGISNDCIPELTGENQNNKNITETKVPEKSDTLLIPEEPRKLKPELIKTCARTNAHVIIEFGLELLESALRQEQLKPKTYRERLDPFIPIIKDCLHSQHVKLRILSLKCLVKLFRKKLPSLNENIGDICDSIFEILGEYSSPAMTGENAELLMSAAKAALVLVHDLDHKIDNCQLRIMLFVAEDLLKNITHYGTGFSLIRAAIKRKFNIPEVHSLMKIVSELSIRSYSEPIRTTAREVYFKYLMDYPHGKKLRQHVQFYVDQLKYDQLDGRKSALEMLRMLLKEIPVESLSNLGNVLHFALACRLDLEESAECKKMVADCLIEIINRVKGTKENDKMFDTVMIWINEPKISVRRLALQILGLYVSTLKFNFIQKLDQILPSIEKQFSNAAPKAIQLESEDSTTEMDHLIFQTLHLYKMILENCPEILTDQKYVEHVDKIGVSCRIFLGHSHEWVRLEAAQILGIILKSINTEHIADAIAKKKKIRNGFLRDDKAKEMVKSLCLDFCDQLAPGYDVMNLLVKEIRSNLLYLVDVLKHIESVDPKKLSLLWLMRKLARLVALEVAKAPLKYTVRTMVYQLFIAMAGKLNEATLSPLLSTILTPIVRELETNDEQGATIRPLAEKVRQFYREKIPSTVYDEVITKVQRKLNIKKTRRKVTRSQMAVTDPEKSASVKVKKQLKKKEQKKRRLEKLRKRKFKSGKRVKLVDVSSK